ncbi:thiamine pyrophosphate-dependent dehydrogenase E1 component subunit alpha [Leptotrichia sp. OH3620_COT-345]|uniref:thiamine pyrophosphate-dependent dehydrogenase E1 component subunit alpha n=1 Tax=Leptotrichia sp. OH3620_COT-345 TaxID=2491048 RepID=UPI000F64ADE2|nr:thiamine pyrophosphate-dependent dehydrogenase E1 component subunit alpha [Leptotrichia sp. OH3620_COT-345]RRD40411.1 thiamine pyrophosphate-dependent dehydrogenase E1 component subunit alpha [Leptotrichia sp. OH3620_COT-345]
MKLSKNRLLNMYELMLDARNFDLKVNQLVKRGMVPGMTHLSVGEEAANIGALAALNPDDIITSNHRGHAQVIGKGIDLNGMMAEIMGKATGTCKGKGGSMHIADLENGNLGANGIVGGGHGIAVGAAYTQKVKNTGKIVVCFFGDGATNEGSFHEALNLASVWKVPVIFYSINNGYGISTSINKVMNIEHIYERAGSYGIPGYFIEDGNDVLAVYETFEKAVKYVREGKGPVLVESITYRWFGHSSSDPGKYRTKEEVDEWKKKDPNIKFKNYLIENKIATEEELEKMDEISKKKIEESVEFAKNSPEPTIESAYEDIFAD